MNWISTSLLLPEEGLFVLAWFSDGTQLQVVFLEEAGLQKYGEVPWKDATTGKPCSDVPTCWAEINTPDDKEDE